MTVQGQLSIKAVFNKHIVSFLNQVNILLSLQFQPPEKASLNHFPSGWSLLGVFRNNSQLSTVGKNIYFSRIITLTGKTKHVLNFIQKYI